MRFMVIVKASKESEAGILPSQEILEKMTKFNEEFVKTIAGIGQLLDLDLVQQKGADFGGTEFLRRAHVEGGELAAVQQVIADGGRTDPFEFEVLFHPIAKLTHGGSPW